MTSKDLKQWQFQQLRASIAPMLRYFARLHDRVDKLGVGTAVPLLVAAVTHFASSPIFLSGMRRQRG